MLGVLTFLVLVRRTSLWLPLLFGVVVVVWIGYLAEPYWSGHFDELFGGLGGIGGNVSSSVAGRIGDGDSVHKLVLYARVALAGGVLALACWGVLQRRAAGFSERSLLVLTFVPFLAFGMQSYGGEMALRVFMFALPGACVLGALALFPRAAGTRRGLGPFAALLTGVVLITGFLVARWGNEPFERVRPGEVAAMDYRLRARPAHGAAAVAVQRHGQRRDPGHTVGREGHGAGAVQARTRPARPGPDRLARQRAARRRTALVLHAQPRPGGVAAPGCGLLRRLGAAAAYGPGPAARAAPCHEQQGRGAVRAAAAAAGADERDRGRSGRASPGRHGRSSARSRPGP
ncbi:hypothetical protein SRIMM317S_05562 [Streptomyces rimosus subsp. rimosus]